MTNKVISLVDNDKPISQDIEDLLKMSMIDYTNEDSPYKHGVVIVMDDADEFTISINYTTAKISKVIAILEIAKQSLIKDMDIC